MPSASSAFRPSARAAPCCHRGHHAVGSAMRSTFQTRVAGTAHPNAQSVTLAATCDSCHRALASARRVLRRGHRGHLDAGQAPLRHHKPVYSGLEQAWESNPRGVSRRIHSPVLLTTELACAAEIPARAVHAHAIHSASAPGGTQEPAPLTRPFLSTSSGTPKRKDPGQRSRPGSLVGHSEGLRGSALRHNRRASP
jgi:hypothetical protein